MRIRTLFNSAIFIAVAMVVVLASAGWFISVRLAALSQTQRLAQSSAREVSDLLVLTHEYALFSEDRAAQQWREHQATIVHMLEAGKSEAVPVSDDALVKARELSESFQRLVEAGSTRSFLRNQQVSLLLSQLLSSAQMLSDSVQLWANDSELQRRQTERWFHILAITIPAAMLTILVALTFLLYRRVLRPLSRLHHSVQAVARGDLTVRSASESRDELGELSRTFNAMAVDLVTELRQEVADRRKMEDQVRQLAFHDMLTSLPNRRLLSDRLSQTMAASKRSGHYGALMFIDLDNFKPLNDTHGHEVGDLLLIEAADRLKSCMRETDTVARFGGDEFVVMLSDLNSDRAESASQAEIVAEKIRLALAEPYLLTIKREGKADILVEHHCTASIGVALFINHEAEQDDILKWADMAMYQAKESGRNRIRFYARTP